MDPAGQLLVRGIAAMLVLCGVLYLRDTLRVRWSGPTGRRVVMAAAVWAAVAVFPPLMIVVAGFKGFIPLRSIPEGPAIFLQMWNFALVCYGVVRVTAKGVELLRTAVRGRKRAAPPPYEPSGAPEGDPPGPALLDTRPGPRRGAGWSRLAAVPLFAVIFTTYALVTRHDLAVTSVVIETGRSPDGTRVRIAHITDLHLGQFFGVESLRFYLEEVKKLKPDLVAVTGDLINSDNEFLREAVPLFRDLAATAPVYACPGNHDNIDNPGEFRRLAREAGVRLLVNQRETLAVRGVEVEIAGLAYAYRGSAAPGFLQKTYRGIRRGRFSVLLAHNPRVFDFAGGLVIDLILSGHTHGGQIVFRRGVNAGSLIDPFFPYSRGHYVRRGLHLYVNSGLGSWFPFRVNCPPEITLVELR